MDFWPNAKRPDGVFFFLGSCGLFLWCSSGIRHLGKSKSEHAKKLSIPGYPIGVLGLVSSSTKYYYNFEYREYKECVRITTHQRKKM